MASKNKAPKVKKLLKLRHHILKDDALTIEAGIDEAGRGCLGGPVYAAVVVLPESFPDNTYMEIKDSKKLNERKREILYEYIKKYAQDYAIVSIPPKRIDEINILQATYSAMHSAIDNLAITPDLLLVDGDRFKPYKSSRGDGEYVEHICIKGGDNEYLAIAAASILAKVSRDRYIKQLCKSHPELNERYGWVKNKAYGTKLHRDGIKEHGISEFHRKTFGICRQYVETDEPLT